MYLLRRVTLRDLAVADFEALDRDVQRQANKQFEKLKRNPKLGKDLGHKMEVDLTGYRAFRFYKNQYLCGILGASTAVVVYSSCHLCSRLKANPGKPAGRTATG